MVDELKPVLENKIKLVPYFPFQFKTENDESILVYNEKDFLINVFGSHNFANLKSAFEVGKTIGLSEENILESFKTFEGAAKRLEKIFDNNETKQTIFRDFAHAPSKVKATVKAVRERYPARKIIAVFELHTYSSLQENFIEQYAHSLDFADVKYLFLDEHALKIKGKQDLDETWLKEQFADDSIVVFKDADKLKENIQHHFLDNSVVLLMSSGNFAGLSLDI